MNERERENKDFEQKKIYNFVEFRAFNNNNNKVNLNRHATFELKSFVYVNAKKQLEKI
jgi:hypothetical protein